MQAQRRRSAFEQRKRCIDLHEGLVQEQRNTRSLVAELQAARGAQEQRLADLRLQRLDLVAVGGLGDTQLVGCARHVQVPRRNRTGVQMVQGVAGKAHEEN